MQRQVNVQSFCTGVEEAGRGGGEGEAEEEAARHGREQRDARHEQQRGKEAQVRRKRQTRPAHYRLS